MDDAKYLIVGGGLAASRACEGIRELDPDGSIAIVTAENHLPYHRPPLSKTYLRGERPLSRLYVNSEQYYRDRNIAVYTGVEATRIARRSRRVTLADGSSIGYEELLLATGGRAWRLPLSGADLEGVHTLRTIEDSDAIRDKARAARHVAVIGGSFIGCEVAGSLAQMGVSVTLCFLEEYPLQAAVAPELGRHVQDMLRARGVTVVAATRPERIEGAGRAERVRLENGLVVDADLVIMGVGIRLNTQLARDCELELTEMSGVAVDDHLRTSDPHIYAAGDIAAWMDGRTGQRTRVEHWDVAYNQGYIAGRNMAGAGEVYSTIPYFFSDILELSFEAWGSLSRPERIITRGALGTGTVTYWYVREGRLAGALAIALPDAEREATVALVRAGGPVEPIEAALADLEVDLNTLL